MQSRFLLAALLAVAGSAQDYLIRTHAGAGTIAENAPANSTYIRHLSAIAVDPRGVIYYAGEDRLRRIDLDGKVVTIAGIGVPSVQNGACSVSINSMAFDASGRLHYGSVSEVCRIDANGVITRIAGNRAIQTNTGDGGPATTATLAYVSGLAFDRTGNLFISSGCRIRKIAQNGIITTVAGNGECPAFDAPLATGVPALTVPLGNVYSIAIAPDGTIYAVVSPGGGIRVVSPDGIVTTLDAVSRASYGLALDKNGTLLTATENGIVRVTQNGPVPIPGSSLRAYFALDAVGNVFAAEENVIVRITPEGSRSVIAGGEWGDGRPARQAALARPSQLVRDGAGNLYFVDDTRVRRIDPNGIITTVAGGHFPGLFGNGDLETPVITVDRPGNLYIAGSGRIRRVDHATGIMTTIAGTGEVGWSGVGGPAVQARIAPLYGIYLSPVKSMAVDPNGLLYFSTYDIIAHIDADGILRMVAGSAVGTPLVDDTNIAAAVTAMTFDATGSLVFANWYPTTRIRRITPAGQIETLVTAQEGLRGLGTDAQGNVYYSYMRGSTHGVVKVFPKGGVQEIAGGPGPYYGHENEDTRPALNLFFNYNDNGNLAVDEYGVLYLGDTNNYRIRRIFPDPCAFFATSTRYVGAGPSTISADVLAGSTCVWSANSNDSWIKIVPSGTRSVGPSNLSITVEANPTAASRTGSISLGGQRLQIQQAGAQCISTVTPSVPQDVPALGTVLQYRVNPSRPGCQWTALSEKSWTEVYPLSGAVPGDLTIRVYPNFSSTSRTVDVYVSGQKLQIRQAANQEPFNYRFVRQLYFGFFGRQPSPAELDFQVNMALNRGVPPSSLFENFMGTEEFNRGGRYVAGLYVGLLNRDAEYGGWLFQRNALSTGLVSSEQLADNFLNSAEFVARYGNTSDPDFVTVLYRQVLLREPTPAEVVFQSNALKTIPRVRMAHTFLESAEFRQGTGPRLTAFLLYALALMREPAPGERALMVDLVREGQSVAKMAEGLIGNQESHLTIW